MTDSFVADCPGCGRRVVVTSLVAACGRCAVVTGARDAKRSWANVAPLADAEAADE